MDHMPIPAPRILLGVNVDHVATIRKQRDTRYPDPVTAAALAELAGADQVTVHLREDRRHIVDRDVRILRETVQTRLNLEMAATDEMQRIAKELRPDQVSLVPEKREERTTEGGLDVKAGLEYLTFYVAQLRQGGVPAVAFIDADPEQVKASQQAGFIGVELHTGDYCDATSEEAREEELERLQEAAEAAAALGLHVAAGHGLDYTNVEAVCGIEEICELNIGHSVISRAVLVGIDQAVREMRQILDHFPRD